MLVTIKASNKKVGQAVCFIDGTLGIFENVVDNDYLIRNCIGKECEVYIINAAAVKDGKASIYHMGVVRPGDKCVKALALECSGSMCSTSTGADIDGKFAVVYPHNCGLYVADNVNASFYHLPYYPRPKMNMWVRKIGGKWKAIGADRIEDLDWHMRLNNPDVSRVEEIHKYFHGRSDRGQSWDEYYASLVPMGYASIVCGNNVYDRNISWIL